MGILDKLKNFNANMGGGQSGGYNYGEYYAVIEQSGLFFSGELPDINFSKVTLCNSYDELIRKLTEKLNEAVEKANRFNEQPPRRTSYQEMSARYPAKRIVPIQSSVFTGNSNMQDRPQMRGNFGSFGNSGYEYYAVVEQSGMFFSGELPDITFGRVSLVRTYDELINELTKKVNEVFEEARKWNRQPPNMTSYQEMERRYPGKKIVAIRPNGRF